MVVDTLTRSQWRICIPVYESPAIVVQSICSSNLLGRSKRAEHSAPRKLISLAAAISSLWCTITCWSACEENRVLVKATHEFIPKLTGFCILPLTYSVSQFVRSDIRCLVLMTPYFIIFQQTRNVVNCCLQIQRLISEVKVHTSSITRTWVL